MNEMEMAVEILNVIAHADMGDYIDIGPDGIRLKRLDEIEPMKLYAIKTYRCNQTGSTFRICLHDKIKALWLLHLLNGSRRPWHNASIQTTTVTKGNNQRRAESGTNDLGYLKGIQG